MILIFAVNALDICFINSRGDAIMDHRFTKPSEGEPSRGPKRHRVEDTASSSDRLERMRRSNFLLIRPSSETRPAPSRAQELTEGSTLRWHQTPFPDTQTSSSDHSMFPNQAKQDKPDLILRLGTAAEKQAKQAELDLTLQLAPPQMDSAGPRDHVIYDFLTPLDQVPWKQAMQTQLYNDQAGPSERAQVVQTDQQSIHEDDAMAKFLDKQTLSERITGYYIKILRINIGNTKGKTQAGITHLYNNLQTLRNYSMYNNTTKQEAIAAYKSIKDAYENGTYNNIFEHRCQRLDFPFART